VVHRVSMDCRPTQPSQPPAPPARSYPRKSTFRSSKFKRRPVHHPHQHHHHRQQYPQPHHSEAWRRLAMTMEKSEASRLQIQRYVPRPHGQAALFNKTRPKLMSVAQRELANTTFSQQQQQQRVSWGSSSYTAYRKSNVPAGGQWYHR
jgi:hypothetical protein